MPRPSICVSCNCCLIRQCSGSFPGMEEWIWRGAVCGNDIHTWKLETCSSCKLIECALNWAIERYIEEIC